MQPKVLVVAPTLGAFSEAWLWRQINGLEKFKPVVLTWQHIDQTEFPILQTPVYNMQLHFNEQNNIVFRSINRFRGLKDYNFCGPSRSERLMIYNCIKKTQPDIVLCHFGYTALRILPILKQFKLPLVVHFHGRDISASLRSKWYRWSFKSMIQQLSAAVVVGGHQRSKLTKEYCIKSDKVFLIPCGVPTGQFTPGNSCRKRNDIVFVSVSRISEEKGVEYSLRAFNEVVSIYPNLRYVIVGDGPLKDKMERLSLELGLGEKVSFVGSKSPREIRELLCESDVFVQHSVESSNGWVEGFGVTIAEASAMNLPVVVTSCGGITDQVIDGVTGYIVPQRDVNAMADRMKRLVEDIDLRSKMGRAGRTRMVKNFDTKKQIQKLEMVLDESINRWKNLD
jgi:glycosyltransferase involved in cell wall biosynthesis